MLLVRFVQSRALITTGVAVRYVPFAARDLMRPTVATLPLEQALTGTRRFHVSVAPSPADDEA